MPFPYHCDVIRHTGSNARRIFQNTILRIQNIKTNGFESSIWRFYRVQNVWCVAIWTQHENALAGESDGGKMVGEASQYMHRFRVTPSARDHYRISEIAPQISLLSASIDDEAPPYIIMHREWVGGWVHRTEYMSYSFVRTSRQIINHRIIQHPIASTIISS